MIAGDVLSVRDEPEDDKQKDNNFVGRVYVFISYNISFVGWLRLDEGLKSHFTNI